MKRRTTIIICLLLLGCTSGCFSNNTEPPIIELELNNQISFGPYRNVNNLYLVYIGQSIKNDETYHSWDVLITDGTLIDYELTDASYRVQFYAYTQSDELNGTIPYNEDPEFVFAPKYYSGGTLNDYSAYPDVDFEIHNGFFELTEIRANTWKFSAEFNVQNWNKFFIEYEGEVEFLYPD